MVTKKTNKDLLDLDTKKNDTSALTIGKKRGVRHESAGAFHPPEREIYMCIREVER